MESFGGIQKLYISGIMHKARKYASSSRKCFMPNRSMRLHHRIELPHEDLIIFCRYSFFHPPGQVYASFRISAKETQNCNQEWAWFWTMNLSAYVVLNRKKALKLIFFFTFWTRQMESFYDRKLSGGCSPYPLDPHSLQSLVIKKSYSKPE
jgi:hypothetical protein